MAERFGTIKHIDRLYHQNTRDYEFDRLENTHGGEDYSPEWVLSRSQVKVCQVPWDTSYNNVIDWANNSHEAYFNGLEGRVFDFSSSWNFKKLEEFKASVNGYVGECDIPLTFEEALYYNYVWIRQYKQHVAKGEVIEDFYFFIHSLDKIAPNTTRLNIHNDIWTQYYTHFTFSYGDLERGHYPHFMETREQFFAHPLASAFDLTEPEPELGSVKSAVRLEDFHMLDSELEAVVVSDTLLYADLFEEAGARWWEDFSELPPRVAEPGAYPRSFERYEPRGNGSSIGRRPGVMSFAGAYRDRVDTPRAVINQSWDNSPAQQLAFYRVSLPDFPLLVEAIQTRFPHLVDKIRAVYVMPGKYIAEGEPVPVQIIGDIQAQRIVPRPILAPVDDIRLTPADFGFDSDFAKIYTSQFSEVEFSTLAGERVTVGFENFSDHVQIMGRSHHSFPFLKLEAFICGIGGNSVNNYAFRAFDSSTASSWADSWEDFRLNLPFPIYSLYMSGDTQNALDFVQNVNAREKIARDNALALQDARNTLENTYNTAFRDSSQGVFSSDIAKETGDRSNTASKTISDHDATTAKTTSDRSTNTDATNSNASNNMGNENTTRTISTDNEMAVQNIVFTFDDSNRIFANIYDKRKQLDYKYRTDPITQQINWTNARQGAKMTLASLGAASGAGFNVVEKTISIPLMSGTVDNTQDRASAKPAEKSPSISSSSMSSETIDSHSGTSGGGPSFPDPVTQTAAIAGQVALVNANLLREYLNRVEDLEWSRTFARDQITDYATWDFNFNNEQNMYNRTNAEDINEILYNRNNDNEANRYRTESGIISRTQQTGLNNNASVYNNSINNNNISFNATAENVQTSRDAGVTNARHTEGVTLANAENNYSVALDRASSSSTALQRAQEATLATHSLQRLQEVGSFSGDNASAVDNGYVGVSVKIRTLPDAQMRQADKIFTRYGYRMKPGTIIEAPDRLSLFTHFTFWKMRDIEGYIDGNTSSVNAIKSILQAGVTVWTSPEVIYNFNNNERLGE